MLGHHCAEAVRNVMRAARAQNVALHKYAAPSCSAAAAQTRSALSNTFSLPAEGLGELPSPPPRAARPGPQEPKTRPKP